MAEYWFTARFSTLSAFFRILRDWEQARWVYAERMETTILAEWDSFWKSQPPSSDWQHGRAFSPTGEIAWWQSGGQVTARAILEKGVPLPKANYWESQPYLQAAGIPLGSESAWLLWKTRPYKKIPAADAQKERQQIIVRIYLASNGAYPLTHRFLRLEEARL